MASYPHARKEVLQPKRPPKQVGKPFSRRGGLVINSTLMKQQFFFGPLSIENWMLPDKPRTLSALNPRQRDAILQFARERAKEPAENETFARFALYLASWAKAGREACWAAAILRDVWNGSTPGEQTPHKKSPAKEFLLSLNLSRAFVEKVGGIVAASNSESASGALNGGQVLWEAVNIQKMGAYGFETKLLPLCREQTDVPPKGESYVENALHEAALFNIPYRKAVEAYIALEPQFRIPLLVEAIANSSEMMHQTFRTALAEPQGE